MFPEFLHNYDDSKITHFDTAVRYSFNYYVFCEVVVCCGVKLDCIILNGVSYIMALSCM